MEALGAAAGVAAIAQLIGQILLRLMEYWDKIQHVPQQLRELTEGIRNLIQVLADVDNELFQIHNKTIVSNQHLGASVQSVKYCRDALEALRVVVEELDKEMGSRGGFRGKLVATKVLYKKGLIDRLESRLEKAVSRLGLAIQCHSL